MAIITTAALDTEQKKQINDLVLSCYKKEPLTLSFPTEDADLYILYEDQSMILSACAFTKDVDDCCECSAFTAPEYRHQGIFSALFDTALELFPEDTDFLFYTDHKSADASETLKAYEAEPLFHEYMMELSDLSFLPAGHSMSVTMTETWQDGTRTFHYQSPYGIVHFSVFSSYYYLYSFEITESFRKKGYGYSMLCEVLGDLKSKNPLPVRLQVSGDNIPALSLYKKAGFQIIETLSCYIY